jgi:hypothetical protein
MVLTLTSAGLSMLLVQATKPADANIAATVMTLYIFVLISNNNTLFNAFM